MLAQALEEALEPPATLVLRGVEGAIADWSGQLAREYLPGTLVLALADGVAGLPPLLDKPRRPGPATGWLCRGATCLEPLSELAALKAALKIPAQGG